MKTFSRWQNFPVCGNADRNGKVLPIDSDLGTSPSGSFSGSRDLRACWECLFAAHSCLESKLFFLAGTLAPHERGRSRLHWRFMRILIAEDDLALASFVKKGLVAEAY